MPAVICPSLSVEADLIREQHEVAEALHLPPELLAPFSVAELDRYYSRPDEFEEQVSPEMLHASLPKDEPQ